MNQINYIKDAQTQIIKNGYFVKNTFICTQDELNIPLKKNKSLSDLPIIKEENEISNILHELSINYKPNIEIYTNLSFPPAAKYLPKIVLYKIEKILI